MNCPNCGFPVSQRDEFHTFDFESQIPRAGFLRDRKPRQPDWKRTDFRDFNFGEGLVIPAGTKYVRKRPARDVTMQSDVSVPVVQSIITGLLIGLAAAVICLVADEPDGAKISLSCAVIVGCVVWLVLFVRNRSLLFDEETITNDSADNDEREREPTTTRIEVDITDDKQKRTIIFNWSVPQDKFVAFAKGILASKSTGVGTWVGSGKLFTPAEYTELRDTLIARRLAEWRNKDAPQQGWKLTLAGMAVFRKLAK